ncbi:hypothetical protein QWY77_03435 [Thalassotalea ponticola]|nr:hypothetical protein [Thalassotalea ponticola]MDN3651818.1 hypothetical protein [Thalassotalea ponticola]
MTSLHKAISALMQLLMQLLMHLVNAPKYALTGYLQFIIYQLDISSI